jgi:hypothetical protein
MSQDNNPTNILYLGCDVAKKTLALDAALLPKLPAVDNDRAGHQQLLRALQARAQKTKQIPHLVVEATGGYEQAVVEPLTPPRSGLVWSCRAESGRMPPPTGRRPRPTRSMRP